MSYSLHPQLKFNFLILSCCPSREKSDRPPLTMCSQITNGFRSNPIQTDFVRLSLLIFFPTDCLFLCYPPDDLKHLPDWYSLNFPQSPLKSIVPTLSTVDLVDGRSSQELSCQNSKKNFHYYFTKNFLQVFVKILHLYQPLQYSNPYKHFETCYPPPIFWNSQDCENHKAQFQIYLSHH